jgi:hypothetical protein
VLPEFGGGGGGGERHRRLRERVLMVCIASWVMIAWYSQMGGEGKDGAGGRGNGEGEDGLLLLDDCDDCLVLLGFRERGR